MDKQYGIVISQIYAPVCMYTHTQIVTLSFIEKIEKRLIWGEDGNGKTFALFFYICRSHMPC